MKKSIFVLIATVFFLNSSKKDKDKNPSNLTMKLKAITAGTLISSYATVTGGTANDQITLPWSKKITVASNATAANIVITGNSGVAG